MITVFLPCRKGSQRVPLKNIKPFSGFEFGLVQIKLDQLLKTKKVDEIILSTNDESILSYANGLSESRLVLHERSEELARNSTSTDELILHALDLVKEGVVLWTHVTSPFVNSEWYDKIINRYYTALNEGFDSLMTTTEHRSFFWKNGVPISYHRAKEKWPRTQEINPLHEVNSAAFIATVDVCRKASDRIGDKPFLYPLNNFIGYDIDYVEEFVIAEILVKQGLVEL